MTNYIKGTCEEMCPSSEVKMRSKEHLLHYFELLNGEPFKPIKCFSRSAAGVKTPRKFELRTFSALENTVNYLLKDIILDNRKPFNYVYDFIFDRLRSVRQEIVIQNLNYKQTIRLIEPIILFLAYSRYRLTEESIANFDPKICDQHLQECIKKVLCCYDELDMNECIFSINEENNRILIESLYQLFNLGKTEALTRSINIKLKIRQHPTFNLSKMASFEYFRGNYFRCLRITSKFYHILAAIASLKLQNIRKEILLQFSHAYNSKQLTVPIGFVQNILYYKTAEELISDLKYFNIEVCPDNNSIKFMKSDFDIQKTIMQSKRENFVEEKFSKIYLPEILLLKRYNL